MTTQKTDGNLLPHEIKDIVRVTTGLCMQEKMEGSAWNKYWKDIEEAKEELEIIEKEEKMRIERCKTKLKFNLNTAKKLILEATTFLPECDDREYETDCTILLGMYEQLDNWIKA